MSALLENFQESFLFSKLPKYESISYTGQTSEKLKKFKVVKKDGEAVDVYSLAIIRKDEKLLWQSFEEALERTVKLAALEVKGFHGFDLLSCDLHPKDNAFDEARFKQLLVNKAEGMTVGDEKTIQYGHVFGLLKKRLNETWGRIEFLANVSTYLKESFQLDLFIKKVIKDIPAGAVLIICDQSGDSIFRFGEDPQTERMDKMFKKHETGELPSEIYYVHSKQTTELLTQFGLK